MVIFYIGLFLLSCGLFYIAGKLVVDGLLRIAKFLGWREFVVAFFVMASAASLPNLIVGLSAALRGIPELSFGDVSGNNLAALTIAVAIAVLLSKGAVPAESRTIRTSAFFVTAAALLPMILILDGTLSRLDGIALIALFAIYISWLFSKKERFTKAYAGRKENPVNGFKHFLKDLVKVIFGLIIFVAGAQGVVISAQVFASSFNMSIVLVGILITGLGSTLPEIYFDGVSALKGQSWMILGDLMGAIIIPSTLVLGIVTLISPMHFSNFSSLALVRIFIVIAALSFPFFIRSGKSISKKEALFLLCIYIIFLLSEIFLKDVILGSGFGFLLK